MNRSRLLPSGLCCEHTVSPRALHTQQPFLSWQLESGLSATVQGACQVVAASSLSLLERGNADLWDSGKTDQQAPHTVYAGKEGKSGQVCYWQVRVWDQRGEASPWSPPAFWEWGLLSNEDWSGQWIGAGENEAVPCFRREFEINKPPRRARAYFSGLGYGELWLNGSRVGTGKFLPAWTNYDRREYRDMLYPFEDESRRRVLYMAYDVDGLLVQGRNAIAALLGNGMHNQRVRTIEGKMWYGPPRMLLELVLEFHDGSVKRIGSGQDWKWTEGPITFNNLFIGEIFDGRRSLPANWLNPCFEDSQWQDVLPAPVPDAPLIGQLCPVDEVIETLKPLRISKLPGGRHVLDFGRVFSGWLKLYARADSGTRVVIRFSEELDPDGELDTRSCGAHHVQQDEWIMSGRGEETYEPSFVWHAFRYAEISGWPADNFDAESVEGIVVHMAIPVSGDFSCSHPVLNKLIRIFRDTQLANSHGGVISDCPHRERLGYTGDAQIASEAVLWNFQASSFYKKWVDDIFDAQNQKTGFIPHTVPFYGGGGGYGWGAAAVVIPWQLYRFNGDSRILVENYNGMVRWLEYMLVHCDSRGVLATEEPGSWCLGDWSFPGKEPTVPPELVNTFYLGHCAGLMESIARVLEKKEDASRFQTLLEKIRRDFHRVFFNAEKGCYAAGTGGADAFAFALGSVPANVQAVVRRSLEKNGKQWDTGFLGTPVLLEMLSAAGFQKEALDLLTRSEFPGFGHMMKEGATTLWENWNRERGSHCHPMFGSICAWIYRHIAGLSQEGNSAGFSKLTWTPWEGPEITEAALSYLSVRGLVHLSWKKNGTTWDLSLQLPPGTALVLNLKAETSSAVQINGVTVQPEEKTSWPVEVAGFERGGLSVSLTILSGNHRMTVGPDVSTRL